MLELQNVQKSYATGLFPKKVPAVRGLSLHVHKGEVFAFLGPNGAGKTTTIKLILNLIFPDSGKIFIDGLPHQQKDARKKVGYLPDQPYFYDYLTAREYLIFSAQLYNLPRSLYLERIPDLLEKVGLQGKEKLQLRKFSRGMLQRLGFAQALIHDPDLLILDEPMGGLDPIGRKEFRDIILELKEQGKTIFFSSHILSDAEVISDRVGILNRGELVRQTSLAEIFDLEVESIEISCRWNGTPPPEEWPPNCTGIRQEQQSTVFASDEQSAQQAVQWVLENKGRIVSVTPHRKTLEDIFMEEMQN